MLWWMIFENSILIRPPTLPIWSFKLTPFTTKIILVGVAFSDSYLFSSHTLAWACMLHLKLHLLLVSFISWSLLNKFQYNFYYCLPYAYSTTTAIFRLIWLFKITPECILHSRVKDFVTQNSIVIFHQICGRTVIFM